MSSTLSFLQTDTGLSNGLIIDITNLLDIPTSNYYLEQPVGLLNLAISPEG